MKKHLKDLLLIVHIVPLIGSFLMTRYMEEDAVSVVHFYGYIVFAFALMIENIIKRTPKIKSVEIDSKPRIYWEVLIALYYASSLVGIGVAAALTNNDVGKIVVWASLGTIVGIAGCWTLKALFKIGLVMFGILFKLNSAKK
jgi:hypothetical protein